MVSRETRSWSVYPVRLRESQSVQFLKVRADEGAIADSPTAADAPEVTGESSEEPAEGAAEEGEKAE